MSRGEGRGGEGRGGEGRGGEGRGGEGRGGEGRGGEGRGGEGRGGEGRGGEGRGGEGRGGEGWIWPEMYSFFRRFGAIWYHCNISLYSMESQRKMKDQKWSVTDLETLKNFSNFNEPGHQSKNMGRRWLRGGSCSCSAAIFKGWQFFVYCRETAGVLWCVKTRTISGL